MSVPALQLHIVLLRGVKAKSNIILDTLNGNFSRMFEKSHEVVPDKRLIWKHLQFLHYFFTKIMSYRNHFHETFSELVFFDSRKIYSKQRQSVDK